MICKRININEDMAEKYTIQDHTSCNKILIEKMDIADQNPNFKN